MNEWKFVNGAEIHFRSDGKPNDPLRGIDYDYLYFPYTPSDEELAMGLGDKMTTLYDIDELQRENEKLKKEKEILLYRCKRAFEFLDDYVSVEPVECSPYVFQARALLEEALEKVNDHE